MTKTAIMVSTMVRDLGAAFTAAALLMVLGCATAGSTPPPAADRAAPLNDWKKVIEVSEEDGVTLRRHVGYLNRQYTETDPEGITFILDASRKRLGFVLPTGQAYAYEIRRQEVTDKRDLGNFGFDNGVRNVLGVAGTVEYEPISEDDVPRSQSS